MGANLISMPAAFAIPKFLNMKCLLLLLAGMFALHYTATAQAVRVSPAKQALDTAKALSQFTLDQWQVENGLPSNSVMAQVKSKSGYLWLATYDGLARFDGVTFKTFNQKTNPTFPTSSLFDLLEDKQGNLWIATNGGGVLKLQDNTFSGIPKNDFLMNESVTSLVEGADGTIWVGTRGGLALIREDAYVDYPELERLRNLHIFTLLIDSKGSLWIGTVGEGLWELHNGLLRNYNTAEGLSNSSVRSLYEDTKGNLWIGTEEGLFLMDNGEVNAVPVLNHSFSGFVNDIIQDELGTLWFATNDGLLRYRNSQFELMLTDPDGGSNELLNLYSDGEGSLWIGTYYKGFLRLRDGKFKNYSRAEGLPNEVVNVVWSDPQGVWVGTNGGLAFIRQGVERVFMMDNSSAANRIRDVYRDSQGTLWVGTNDGMFRKKGAAFERVFQKGAGLSSDKIRRIIEDRQGRLWIGTRNGLFVRNPDNPSILSVVDELSGVFILSLFIDSQNNLWVATNGKGLYKYNGSNFEHFTTENGLSSDVLFDVWEDQEGIVWACSNAGLSVYLDGRWKVLDESNGLFVNTLFQILSDGMDNLWLTTNRGIFLVKRTDLLSMVQKEQKELPIYKQFTTADGMRSSEITAVSISRAAANGVLWFATFNGVSAIHPARISTNHTPPQVLVEKIVVNKQEMPLTNAAVLFPAGARQYEFTYTAFNYYAPDVTTFSYKLDGFDTEWQEAGRRRIAYYTNIPAGNYVFRVRAANEDGVWSESEAEVPVVQEAFFLRNLVVQAAPPPGSSGAGGSAVPVAYPTATLQKSQAGAPGRGAHPVCVTTEKRHRNAE